MHNLLIKYMPKVGTKRSAEPHLIFPGDFIPISVFKSHLLLVTSPAKFITWTFGWKAALQYTNGRGQLLVLICVC